MSQQGEASLRCNAPEIAAAGQATETSDFLPFVVVIALRALGFSTPKV